MATPSARTELTSRIIQVYPNLPPKRKLVADLFLSDYKKVFLCSAKEIAQECGVSEPTITRFAMDLGFKGYAEFEQYLKGLLHIELTSVERMVKESQISNLGEDGPILARYCQKTIETCQKMAHAISEDEMKSLAKAIKAAPDVVVAAYRASSPLAQYFGYMLEKVRDDVIIDTDLSYKVYDRLALKGPNVLVVAIAFPRYPQNVVDLLAFARHFGCQTIGISDTPLSPVIAGSDLHAVLDIEGISFIDPFGPVVTFLGALCHEIAFMDKDATLSRLKALEKGVGLRGDFFQEEGQGLLVPMEKAGSDPLGAKYYLTRVR
jgi:DNA-binding MurR/RpiR family transcriptional regulator